MQFLQDFLKIGYFSLDSLVPTAKNERSARAALVEGSKAL
jgi:hypothetical protein